MKPQIQLYHITLDVCGLYVVQVHASSGDEATATAINLMDAGKANIVYADETIEAVDCSEIGGAS